MVKSFPPLYDRRMPQELSLTGKKWVIRNVLSDPENIVSSLFASREIDPLRDGELIDPLVFNGMQRAVARIRHAIEKGETVGIFGDYDCDGITSALQLVRFFGRRGIDPLVRLPNRIHDGYGLKEKILFEFIEKGTSLLITVDTGINAVNEIIEAKSRGMDVIITDHHHPVGRIPGAFAVVHPAFCDYPLPHPSGAGVAYHLLRALEDGDWEGSNIDAALAMIGTIADVVELKGQNRTLVQIGLSAINKIGDGPLAELIALCRLNKAVTSTDIAFRIAPRINAAGRMADPLIALQALMKGGVFIEYLNELNRLRQEQTDKYLDVAINQIGDCADSPLIAAAREDFPQGIVGLIAGKLTERFGKPSMVGRLHGGICTASLRSTSAYHITEGLQKCSGLLQYFGGHAQAAGCSFKAELFSSVVERLREDISENVEMDDLVPTMEIDAELTPDSITPDLISNINKLEPFGKGNPEPLFIIRNIKFENARIVGKGGNHLQGTIAGVKSVGFGLGFAIEHARPPIDAVCRLGLDEWNGYMRPQIFIEDLRKVESGKWKVENINKRKVESGKQRKLRTNFEPL